MHAIKKKKDHSILRFDQIDVIPDLLYLQYMNQFYFFG